MKKLLNIIYGAKFLYSNEFIILYTISKINSYYSELSIFFYLLIYPIIYHNNHNSSLNTYFKLGIQQI